MSDRAIRLNKGVMAGLDPGTQLARGSAPKESFNLDNMPVSISCALAARKRLVGRVKPGHDAFWAATGVDQ